jgi:uncharacterized protein YjbI with pentapeptide repeats
MTEEKLKQILEQHKLWLDDPTKGSRADFSWAYLTHAELREANLRAADFIQATLREANLEEADLTDTILDKG